MTRRKAIAVALKARRHGAKRGYRVALEADRARIPLALAFALFEKENTFQNIFGCDYGQHSGPPYCHQRVTKRRVEALLNQRLNNGVGWGQLTSRSLVLKAQALGGAHIPRHQIRVALEYLGSLVATGGFSTGRLNAYNGDPTGQYGRDLYADWQRWRTYLGKHG